jgi:hypothetical protein
MVKKLLIPALLLIGALYFAYWYYQPECPVVETVKAGSFPNAPVKLIREC